MRAFQALYSLAFAHPAGMDEVVQALAGFPGEDVEDGSATAGGGYAWQLTCGVWRNETILDRAIEHFSRNWRVERMGKIELVLLRLMLFELLAGMTPPGIVINEALELADRFGAGDAKKFVHGILAAAAKSSQSRQYADELKICPSNGEL